MSEYIYVSRLKEHIQGLICQKRALGFAYKTGAYLLHVFDRFVAIEFSEENTISQAMALRWAELKPSEHINNLQGRIYSVRQLALYMNRSGTNAYVLPEAFTRKRIPYIPHVFTDPELRAFFHEVDAVPFVKHNPARSLVVPVIFRLLYCCGLRPSEAVHLRTEDVDLESGVLTVRQAKGNKDRLAVLAYDVLNLCRRYDERVSIVWPRRKIFFPNGHGYAYTPGYISDLFRGFWTKTSIRSAGENRPRLYDLRHSFCVKRLNHWVREGRDLNAALPYLSMYMGHSSFSNTDYYLHLVPDFYPELLARSAFVADRVIPEVE